MLGEEYNASSSALWNVLHSPVISSLLPPNIFLSTLFSNTLNLCSPLNVRDQVHNHTINGGCWDIYVEVHLIMENLTKVIFSSQDYQNLSFHEIVK